MARERQRCFIWCPIQKKRKVQISESELTVRFQQLRWRKWNALIGASAETSTCSSRCSRADEYAPNIQPKRTHMHCLNTKDVLWRQLPSASIDPTGRGWRCRSPLSLLCHSQTHSRGQTADKDRHVCVMLPLFWRVVVNGSSRRAIYKDNPNICDLQNEVFLLSFDHHKRTPRFETQLVGWSTFHRDTDGWLTGD